MRLITRKTVRRHIARHPAARAGLTEWLIAIEEADWHSIVDVRAIYPHADAVVVSSGRVVVVFNHGGNNYRLVAALHYDKQRAYVRDFMTHAQYDRDAWKGRH